jgi:predicted nicotinamide N-methyase
VSLTDYTIASRRQRLLARIHRRYVTTTQAVRVGSLIFDFTRITDPDLVLDEVAAEADRRERVSGLREPDEHLHLPYWAELWDSAAGIGQFLVGKPAAPPADVLDLGCGMGLSGTVAAALGASVLFADVEPPALLFAQVNSLPWANRVRTRQLNWQTDRLAEQFNLILGADILYERAQWEFLEPFWQHHLAPDGILLLGEPGRQTGDLFIHWIVQRGWKLQIFEEKVPTREKPVRIFELARS